MEQLRAFLPLGFAAVGVDRAKRAEGSLLGRVMVLLIALSVLLGSVAFSIPLLLRKMDEAVARTFRHEVAWTAHHGRTELNLAYRTIVELELGTGTLADAHTAIDIFYSRMTTWANGQLGSFIHENEITRRQFAEIEKQLHDLDTVVGELGDPNVRRKALTLLGALEPNIASIASETYVRFLKDRAQNSETLRFYNRLQTTVVACLVACGFLLTFGLIYQNRRLLMANRRQIEIAQQNAFLADHDPLTGLPNRKRFLARLEDALRTRSPGRDVAVVAIDLDGFKPVNDVLGHKAGDLLLVSVAEKLRHLANVAEGGMAARFGGDEFLIMLQGVSDGEIAEAFAEHVGLELRKPNAIGDHQIALGATIGVAVTLNDRETASDLIQRADIALNAGKASGKGSVRTFHPRMLEGAALRGQLEAELNAADLAAEIEVHFQPVIDLPSREIIGVEALARWRHPTRGLVPPSEFIPIAESSGRIVDIGAIILRKACQEAMSWARPIKVAVNLSPVQLRRSDVVQMVWETLAETRLPATRLKLEITESVLMGDEQGTSRLLQELQDIGVAVSLDDFGTGYSSLSYLRRFRFDELKIDRSFLADINNDGEAAAVVQTILALACSLNMSVVAEGIETEQQAMLLTAMGCAKGQGWLFGKAMRGADLRHLLGHKETRTAA